MKKFAIIIAVAGLIGTPALAADRAFAKIEAGGAHVMAPGRRFAYLDDILLSLGVLLNHHGIAAFGSSSAAFANERRASSWLNAKM